MSTPPPPSFDPIALFVLGGAILFSPEVAGVVGPYLAVFTASVVGGGFALVRRKRTSRRSAVWFFLRVSGASILLTSAIATLVAGAHPSLTERTLLVPIALLIGAVGDDWGLVLSALWSKADLILAALKGNKP